MKVIRRIIYWVAVFVLVVITFWFGYLRKPAETSAENKITPVEVETVTTGSIEETIELTGWIRADQLVDVASKVAGRVESLHVITDSNALVPVEEGVLVKKGRQIAIIDHDVYLAQLAAAEASVKAREVELKDAEREKGRIIGLYEGGSATEQTRDKTVTAAELAAASLSLAKANLELARLNLRESTIVSPIDGIVTVKYIDMGNLIRVGERLVTVADMKTVKVVVPLAERYTAKVTVGMPVRISVDAYQDKEFNAKVYSIYPALDNQTHTILIEIRLNNEQLLLKPGMFARVTLITEQKDNVVVIPRDVILGGKINKPYVYVIDGEDNGKVAHKRIVEIGIKQGDRYEITGGLKTGETLVVNGMNFLMDGIGVRVVKLEDIK
jgi:membrane fusion protein (multidrug efflux system)